MLPVVIPLLALRAIAPALLVVELELREPALASILPSVLLRVMPPWEVISLVVMSRRAVISTLPPLVAVTALPKLTLPPASMLIPLEPTLREERASTFPALMSKPLRGVIPPTVFLN
jgi:hypothetical protein